MRDISPEQFMRAVTEIPEQAMCYHGSGTELCPPDENHTEPIFMVQLVGHVVFTDGPDEPESPEPVNIPDAQVINYRVMFTVDQMAQVIDDITEAYRNYLTATNPLAVLMTDLGLFPETGK
jgi:hypothetical protein